MAPVITAFFWLLNVCCTLHAYNFLPGGKCILNCPGSGHGKFFNYSRHRATMHAWLRNRMARDFV